MTSRRLQPLGIIVVCVALALPAAAQESVTFTQLLPPPETGPVSLTGTLYKPAGRGPFAALVIIHGCSGILAAYLEWAEFLRDHGYVSLVVDNFGPRGVKEACTGQAHVPFMERVRDAYGALAYLSRQAFVDPKRIGTMGFSQGGITTLFNVFTDVAREYPATSPRFKVAAPFYPECRDFPSYGFVVQNRPLSVPMLILTGALDDWTPATYCRALVAQAVARRERAFIKVYPGAHHSFDNLRVPTTYLHDVFNPHSPTGRGATVGGNRAARDAARVDLLAFLKTQL